MLKRLIEYLGRLKRPDFYDPSAPRHMTVTLRGPERILETSVYDPKDEAWYVQSHEKFSDGDAYTNNEIAAWTYLPIRRLARITEKELN